MTLRYFFAWFPMMLLAIVNGMVREFVYKPFVGELTAHQISTVLLILLFTAYIWLIEKRWNLTSPRQALTIGGMWCAMTFIFEFGFGHFVAGHPWERLIEEYNLAAGRIWVLIPLWIATAPIVIHKVQSKLS